MTTETIKPVSFKRFGGDEAEQKLAEASAAIARLVRS